MGPSIVDVVPASESASLASLPSDSSWNQWIGQPVTAQEWDAAARVTPCVCVCIERDAGLTCCGPACFNFDITSSKRCGRRCSRVGAQKKIRKSGMHESCRCGARDWCQKVLLMYRNATPLAGKPRACATFFYGCWRRARRGMQRSE